MIQSLEELKAMPEYEALAEIDDVIMQHCLTLQFTLLPLLALDVKIRGELYPKRTIALHQGEIVVIGPARQMLHQCAEAINDFLGREDVFEKQ